MQATSSVPHVDSDHDYAALEALIAKRVAEHKGPFFTTNATGLWEAYLAGIPGETQQIPAPQGPPRYIAAHSGIRQHYNCNCCRRFVTNFGGLVTIDELGGTVPLLWDWTDGPNFFRQSLYSLYASVVRSKVTGVFINGEKEWGHAKTGEWTHLHGFPAEVFKSPLKTASQLSAEKLQDYITLRKGLEDYSLDAAVQAVRVLEADAVDRSEKTLGVAQWLLDLHKSITDKRGPVRDNLIWRAVATAPAGWCHIRSTMISTLLDDVVAGLPFDTIKRRWDAKMHPLKYQRPVAPPAAGNIAAANKIMDKLGAEGSLARRFARLDEITALWRPKAEEPLKTLLTGGVFDYLRSKSGIKEVELPAKKITWAEFRPLLATASEVEVLLTGSPMAFYGLVTAVNPDSPPMLQWDGLDGLPRNPVSWYFWSGGSYASQWGVPTGWNKVAAISLKPCYWQSADDGMFKHQGKGVFFTIEAAKDSRDAGGGYFPETLRAEYHGIRNVMEAHSRSTTIAGKAEGNANGIALDENHPLTVRIKTKTGITTYNLSL